MDMMEQSEITYAELRARVDAQLARAHAKGTDLRQPSLLVLDVRFNVVADSVVRKWAFALSSEAHLARWLKEPSLLRLGFVGAARNYALAMYWTSTPNTNLKDVEHVDPHFCSTTCMVLQADVCSACCGCREGGRPRSQDGFLGAKWNGFSTLSHANTWSIPISGLETLTVLLGGYVNFEVVFSIASASAKPLWTIIDAFIKLHHKMGGRSHFRTADGRVVYWDVSMRVGYVVRNDFRCVFELLAYHGVKEVALHPGKNVAYALEALQRYAPQAPSVPVLVALGLVDRASAAGDVESDLAVRAMFRLGPER